MQLWSVVSRDVSQDYVLTLVTKVFTATQSYNEARVSSNRHLSGGNKYFTQRDIETPSILAR